MKNKFYILLLSIMLGISTYNYAQNLTAMVTEDIRERLELIKNNPFYVDGEILFSVRATPKFYEARGFRPAWITENGLSRNCEVLIKTLNEADKEGLNPNDYHLQVIERLFATIRRNKVKELPPNIGRHSDLELLLTDAFLTYGSHLLSGKVNPETIDPEWIANRRDTDMSLILKQALESNTIRESLLTLLPPQEGYKKLKAALARLLVESAKGGWNNISDGDKIEPGNKNDRVSEIRSRLISSGYLSEQNSIAVDSFDSELQNAIIKFQKNHGLDPDGKVGKSTLAALNTSIDDRINQVIVNLERWRWMPQDMGKKFILVNIANYELDVVENDEIKLNMRIIVGLDNRRTPVFSDLMTYIVLSPYWNVPPSLAVQDKLPLIKKDIGYLSKNRIKVFEGWGENEKEIDPATVDWKSMNEKNFRYRFRQDPGPGNSLGKIKFMFPNKFNVYLHDTPGHELFKKTERSFSSGCIRIEKPVELAEYLLNDGNKWSKEKIVQEINNWKEKTISLPRPIQVHILYWTAWVDKNGSLQFRNDIYGRDKTLLASLTSKSPNR